MQVSQKGAVLDVKRIFRRFTLGQAYVLASILIVLALVLAGALYLGSEALRADYALMSDPAADMLLEREIDDKGYLLTGHYSVFEFNHPGPFFLYAYHLVHSILDGPGHSISVVAHLTTVLLNVFFFVGRRDSRALCPWRENSFAFIAGRSIDFVIDHQNRHL